MTTAYGFDTLQIHAGARPDPATGARQTPIYQTTAYVFRDADHAAALFNLQEVGFIYSRLTNPTVAVLQERIATLEGGVGAVCCASGHAAQIMALFPLMGPGRNLVASTRLYGGTVTQFSHTIRRFGWSPRFLGFDHLDAVQAILFPLLLQYAHRWWFCVIVAATIAIVFVVAAASIYRGTWPPFDAVALALAIILLAPGLAIFYIEGEPDSKKYVIQLGDAEVPEIPWSSARSYKSEGIIKFMDQLSVWMGLAIFLVVIAYLPSLITMMANLQPVPGFKLW